MAAKLCVNIDHVATVRQARLDPWPDPVAAARTAEKAGALGITAHLREDRRHIQDRDIAALRKAVKGKFNLEMAATPAMLRIARRVKPDEATLVPEKRAELTTEGGLQVSGRQAFIGKAVAALKAKGIVVSLFIDPSPAQFKASAGAGADYVELHTGAYSRAHFKGDLARRRRELEKLKKGAQLAHRLGLGVNAGHGLTLGNTRAVARLPHIEDLNIGHALVSHAVMVGFARAVRDFRKAMR
jgi:pyridoxine 5-phosphate synthase